MSFAGQTALITGGGRGIGAAIAARLAAQGVSLLLVDRDEAGLKETAAALSSGCSGALDPRPAPAMEQASRCPGGVAVMMDRAVDILAADIAGQNQAEQAVAMALARWERLDILVNNAGIVRDGWAVNLTDEDWDEVLAVDLRAAFRCCRAAIPAMRRQHYGRIVNIASRAALGNPGQANYSAAKAGLIGLTRTLALELAADGITVNAVAPGLIDTPLTRRLTPAVRERLMRAQPGGTMGQPEDVARAAAFFADPGAGYVTGQVLYVDGGKSVGSYLS